MLLPKGRESFLEQLIQFLVVLGRIRFEIPSKLRGYLEVERHRRGRFLVVAAGLVGLR